MLLAASAGIYVSQQQAQPGGAQMAFVDCSERYFVLYLVLPLCLTPPPGGLILSAQLETLLQTLLS